MTKALDDVLAERERQPSEGWTKEHDDGHTDGWLADAASEMLARGQHVIKGFWAWAHKHPDSPDRKSRREQLVIGTALGLAEIERIDRAVEAGHDPFPPSPPPDPEVVSNAQRRRRWPGGHP